MDTLVTYQENGARNSVKFLVNGKIEGHSYMYNQNDEIVGFLHYKNDTLSGYGVYLYKDSKIPKYIAEFKDGEREGIIIEFDETGRIKYFSSGGIYTESQKIRFHENGVIKSIGKTKVGGQAHGTRLYFNEKGILERMVEYENGEPKK